MSSITTICKIIQQNLWKQKYFFFQMLKKYIWYIIKIRAIVFATGLWSVKKEMHFIKPLLEMKLYNRKNIAKRANGKTEI